MQTATHILRTNPAVRNRPQILSFDSGDECGLDHWLAVFRLVEDDRASSESYGKRGSASVRDDETLIRRTLMVCGRYPVRP